MTPTGVHSRRTLARQVVPAVDAALQNEQLTRQRVTALEQWAQTFMSRTWWERWRWLVLGR